MSSSALFKFAGTALGMGAAAYIVLALGGDFALGPGVQHFTSPLYAPLSSLQAVAGFALVLGLIGHYARQHVETGKLGLVGVISLGASIAMYAFALPLMGAIVFGWLAAQPATEHALEGSNAPGGLMVRSCRIRGRLGPA